MSIQRPLLVEVDMPQDADVATLKGKAGDQKSLLLLILILSFIFVEERGVEVE